MCTDIGSADDHGSYFRAAPDGGIMPIRLLNRPATASRVKATVVAIAGDRLQVRQWTMADRAAVRVRPDGCGTAHVVRNALPTFVHQECAIAHSLPTGRPRSRIGLS